MLYLRFGKTEDTIFNISDWFNTNFENEWFHHPLVKEMVQDVDQSTIIGDRVVDSPVLGTISHRELSGEVKALIMMLFEPEREYNGSACGDNCAKWILEIAKLHDIYLAFGHTMIFPEPFEIYVTNIGKIVKNMKELLQIKLKLHREDDSFEGELQSITKK